MTTDPTTDTSCPACGAGVPASARFCEACGAAAPAAAGAGTPPPPPPTSPDDHPLLGNAPISAPTTRPAAALPDPPAPPARRPCESCGGEVGSDGYCMECGTKARSERDHFREAPASWAGGVCDKGIGKAGNEDAMALLAAPEPGSRAVLVVLDGVSNSENSAKASLAGARAARDVLRMPLPVGMGTVGSRASAAGKVFTDAAKAANAAIVAATDPDSTNPASATFTAAVLEGSTVTFANIGDSRAYWLPDDGAGLQLTVDDSLAQAQITAGIPREIAEASAQAHAITKWLGRDSEDITPTVGSIEVTEPGWLLACSDGLWNYASEPAALQAQIQAAKSADPVEVALHLVAYANAGGGHDNITAALARVAPPTPTPEAAAGHNEATSTIGDAVAPSTTEGA